MKIHLPNSAWIGNIDRFISSFDTSDESILEITSHKKWISVHPVVSCMIAGLVLFMKKQGKKISFKKMEARSKHYFKRIGLFDLLDLDSEMKITSHESAGRFIQITRITNSKELDDFIKEIIPLLHMEPDKFEPIRYILEELVRNVFEHAYSEEGAIVCAQYYQQSKTIRIGVVDIGIGIRESMSGAYPTKDDVEAISLALTPGITGTTRKIGGTEANAGAGLFFIKSLAKISRDFFMLYSGKGMYKLLKNPKHKPLKLIANPLEDHFSSKDKLPFWHGTVVAIDLCLERTLDFDAFLDLINKVYRKGRKDQTKKRYKRPKFI